jgi:RNA polymerase sigma factor (sigma-70 family)
VVDRASARRPFEDVVREHGSVVMRVCCAVVGPVDAEDAWSDTFLAALRAYPDLRPDSNVRGWLVTIAHNKAIDVLRRRRRFPVPSADVPEPGPKSIDGVAFAAQPAVDDRLRDALNALPPKQRSAVIYRHVADLSYSEIGALLDSNEGAARRNVADGLARLRQLHETRRVR